jgi:septum formation topological specificity factor MinE
MKARMIICNEADYLQAHLTVILAESRRRNPALDNLKQRVASVLKKWVRRVRV